MLKSNKLNSKIKLVDLSILLDDKILILSDLHIGFEESLNKFGILIPRFQFKRTKTRLKKILDEINPEKIIINGDLKHEFGKISKQEWRDTFGIIELLKKYTKEIFLIKGNHDKILEPIAEKYKLRVLDEYIYDDILITHGHKINKNSNNKNIKTIIVGHEHPAIAFSEKPDEIFKCFLIGKFNKKNLVVLPSFNLVTQGSNILREKTLSPYVDDVLKFKVIAVSDNGELFDFGKVKDLRNK